MSSPTKNNILLSFTVSTVIGAVIIITLMIILISFCIIRRKRNEGITQIPCK